MKKVDQSHTSISVVRQCQLLGISRSSFYYKPRDPKDLDKRAMDKIDEIYTKHPFYGSRKIAFILSKQFGFPVNRKLVQRLMRKMGIQAVYPKPNTSRSNKDHKKYPYLLGNLAITGPNQVWSTDITYIRLEGGFAYLVAVIDWYSRRVLSWRMSNTMDTGFCLEALEEAVSRHGTPMIFNTDQGSQFTSNEFTTALESRGIRISMDSKGRALDNIFIERLWRSVKYENVYLKGYRTIREAKAGLNEYFQFYNNERIHQSLNYQTPDEVHFAKAA